MSKISKKLKFFKKKIDIKKIYFIDDAINLIKKYSKSKFNESIDISIHLSIDSKKSDQIIRGFVVLPFSIKKKIRILVFAKDDEAKQALEAGADFVGMEDLVNKIKLKKIFFDVVLASPKSVSILNSLGEILGPKGLMPNYKTGTLSSDIFNTVKNFKLGQIKYRSDKYGIINSSIGKINFKTSDLKSNILVLINSINKNKPVVIKNIFFRKIFLSSTMGFGIEINQNFLKK